MESILEAHGQAFDQGLISCQRLIDVVVPPFLKLARHASLAPVPGSNAAARKCWHVKNSLFHSWSHGGLQRLLAVAMGRSSDGSPIAAQLLRPQKRAEFVKTLLKNHFAEVRSR